MLVLVHDHHRTEIRRSPARLDPGPVTDDDNDEVHRADILTRDGHTSVALTFDTPSVSSS